MVSKCERGNNITRRLVPVVVDSADDFPANSQEKAIRRRLTVQDWVALASFAQGNPLFGGWSTLSLLRFPQPVSGNSSGRPLYVRAALP